MNLREGLGDSYRKGEIDGKKKKYSGSRGYQKFFEDYEEIKVPKKNGRGSRIERIYTGDYYRQEYSDGRWYAMKVVYPLLIAVSFLFFGSAAFPGSGANRIWYVNLPQAVSMAGYFWTFMVMCFYVAAPRNMTVSGWKRACRPIKTALKVLCGAVMVTAGGTCVYYVLHASEFTGQVFMYFSAYLFCAVLIGIVYFLESRTAYQKRKAQSYRLTEQKATDIP